MDTHQPDIELMTAVEVAGLLRITTATLRRMILDGVAPPQVNMGVRHRRWIKRDVVRWLEERARVPE